MNGDKKKTLNDFFESDTLNTFGEKSADADELQWFLNNALRTNTTGGYYTPHISDDLYEHEGLFGNITAPGDTTLYRGTMKSNSESAARAALLSRWRGARNKGNFEDWKFEEVPLGDMTFSEALENYKFKENPIPEVKNRRRKRRK